MTFYSDMQNVVSEVMSGDFSQGVVKLISVTPGAGPEDNPGQPSELVHLLDAVVSGVSYNFVKRGLAVESDLMVISSVLSNVTPTEKDFIEIDGVRYKIHKDVSVPASGTKVAWKFIVRKGA
ncbi:MAG: hypothetical protein CMC15_18735 [Flavobacteriaceae bacterium]|nr:hypothetical protein [Flavobacteriaceae bacterium]